MSNPEALSEGAGRAGFTRTTAIAVVMANMVGTGVFTSPSLAPRCRALVANTIS